MHESKDKDTKSLMLELEQFKKEKEQIRAMVGQIGGAVGGKKDKIIDITFIVALALLFGVDVCRHSFAWVNIPEMLSLEVAVLMVSIKIIWMIHKQSKVEHFQFWILNSIEFRLNDLGREVHLISKRIKEQEDTHRRRQH